MDGQDDVFRLGDLCPIILSYMSVIPTFSCNE